MCEDIPFWVVGVLKWYVQEEFEGEGGDVEYDSLWDIL
jgi:hypothetical protein